MHALAAQLMYLLQRGQVEVVITVYTCHDPYYRTGGEAFQEDALVMRVDHELELW
jgi:hypothetical protein